MLNVEVKGKVVLVSDDYVCIETELIKEVYFYKEQIGEFTKGQQVHLIGKLTDVNNYSVDKFQVDIVLHCDLVEVK